MLLTALLLLLPAGAAVPSTPRPTATAVPVRTIVGRIVSVDAAKREVVLSESVSRTGKRKTDSLVLLVDARTALTRGKTPVTFDALAPGDQVVARYLANPGAPRALSIRVADAVPTPIPKAQTPPPSPP